MPPLRIPQKASSHSLSLPIPRSLLSLPFSCQPDPDPDPESESESETRISTAVSILLHHRSNTRWNYLQKSLTGSESASGSGLSPSEFVQIITRIRNNSRLALRFFHWSRHRDLPSFAAAVHVLARSRRRPEALSLLRSAIRIHDPGSEPESDSPPKILRTLASTYRAAGSAPFVFDLLIEAYLQSKKLDRAVQIVRILRSRGIQPLVSTSNSLIKSISQIRGSIAGLAIYNELFQSDEARSRVRVPNVRTFNTLLLAFYRDGDLAMMGKIREEMERFGCELNVFTYSILMAGFGDEGMVDEARRLWEEMAGKNIKPDITAFNTLINGYCEAGEMERAEEVYREMVFSEIEPTCVTFEQLIRGYCKVKNADSALALYKDMKRRGFAPEVSAVDEVLEVLCERRRVDEGLRILREEMRREGFGPSRRSYELLVEGFCKEGEMEVAMRLQAEMAGKGFDVGPKVYGDFIEGYRRLGDVEMVKRLEDEMSEMVKRFGDLRTI